MDKRGYAFWVFFEAKKGDFVELRVMNGRAESVVSKN